MATESRLRRGVRVAPGICHSERSEESLMWECVGLPAARWSQIAPITRLFWIAFVIVLHACSVRAGDTNTTPATTLTVDGVTFEDIRWGSVTPTTVTIFHSSGVATLPLAKLPEDLQKRFGYGRTKPAKTPERRFEEEGTCEYEKVVKGIDRSRCLSVRVYYDGEVTFQVDSVYDETTKYNAVQGGFRDLTKEATEESRSSLDLPYLTTNKLSEVVAWLDKMDEWEQAVEKNKLGEITKDLPNPWNVRMTFFTYRYPTGDIGCAVKVSGKKLDINGTDRKKFRTLLSRLDSCVLKAKQKMQDSSEQQERQKKANELLK